MQSIGYQRQLDKHTGQLCSCKVGISLYRCADCFQSQAVCRLCLLKQHLLLPFHRVFVWSTMGSDSADADRARRDRTGWDRVPVWQPDDEEFVEQEAASNDADVPETEESVLAENPHAFYFVKTSLARMGMVIRLGHGGYRCTAHYYDPDPLADIHILTVIHENGVHVVRVQYCRCGPTSSFVSGAGNNAPHQQLWQHSLYPASYKQPKTAASESVLEMFRILCCEGPVNSSAFFVFLRRLSAVAFEEESPVRCT